MTLVAGDKRARQAAMVNGLLVFGAPAALMVAALLSTSRTGPSEIRTGRAIAEALQFGLISAGSGAVAAWRTLVHARRYMAGRSRGWQGVGEAAVCGLVVAILYLAPGIVTRPREAPPYIVIYGSAAAILGAIAGLVLRTSAVIVLRLSKPVAV